MASSTLGRWRKRGLIFHPQGQGGWMNTHAQVPTALLLADRIRVYVASRPSTGLSLTTFIDLDVERPERILQIGEKPILELGEPGTFDEHGIMPAAVVPDGDLIRLYYSGWCRLGGKAPYHNTTGVAVSADNGQTFRRLVPGPVLDRAPDEPYSATSPWVLRIGDIWHVYYSSGLSWIDVESKPEHVYDIRHAVSSDGIHWRRDGRPAIAQTHPEEALTRPTVLRRGNGEWWMWFSYRGSRGFRTDENAYRIGFARSSDLVNWERDDTLAGIETSGAGWDATMIAYPCVLQTPFGLLMFYNGDGFGRAGFGYAVWEAD